MRDRLRAVNGPSEMIDQIGGWSPLAISDQGYDEIGVERSFSSFASAITHPKTKGSHSTKGDLAIKIKGTAIALNNNAYRHIGVSSLFWRTAETT